MLIEVPEKVAKKIVVKRDGKKVEFDGAKIALAIQKGFGDIVGNEDSKTAKYNETDVNKVYSKVLGRIQKIDSEKIKIEEIQDLIEEELKNNGYQDVYGAFASYREKRAQSRQLFFDEKKQHKFLKALENLGLKSANVEENKREKNNDSETTMGNMFQYASAISRQFAITYLMKKKFSEAHENGDIYIHGMNFIPTGTTSSCQIDISKLYDDGFYIGNNYIKEPNGIIAYSNLATVAIQANQNDQHGGQSIPNFDYAMALGVRKTYKKELRKALERMLEFEGATVSDDEFKLMFAQIEANHNIEIRMNDAFAKEEIYQALNQKYGPIQGKTFDMAFQMAKDETFDATYQAMEALVHNLNTMHSRAGAQVPFSSLNYGTDTSDEGRMVMHCLLDATMRGLGNGETPIFPIQIFKVKEGINYNPEDPNYDLFKKSMLCSGKRLFPNFSFIDAPYNKQYYKPGDYKTEVAYMGCRTRVIANVYDPSKEIVTGRGNLSFTSINLPRIALKLMNVVDEKERIKKFYENLDYLIDLCANQLLERFEIQQNKYVYNFPFLMGQKIWLDSDKLHRDDKVSEVIKHGTLTIGFIGLAETLKALIGKHHGESEVAQQLGLEIIGHMREKIDRYSKKYKLNFSLIATPAEGLSGRFVKMDRELFGEIEGITNHKFYTNSFHIPVYYNISVFEKIFHILK